MGVAREVKHEAAYTSPICIASPRESSQMSANDPKLDVHARRVVVRLCVTFEFCATGMN